MRGTVAILVDQVESFNGYTRQSTQNLRKGSTFDRLLHTNKTEGQELNTTVSEMRRSYGTELRNLFPGDHFGDMALLLTHSISPNTFMSNELCQVLAVGKEVFHKLLATHLQSALLKKAYFVACHRLLDDWSPVFVRQLSVSLCERKMKFQDILFQEGSVLRSVYFIKSGSFKLSASNNKLPPRDLINRAADCPDCTPDRGGRPPTTRKSSTQRLPQRSLSSSSLPSDPSTSRLHAKKPTQRRCYRLHEPLPPSTGVHVSVLGPGDLLGGVEAVCQLKHTLFTAVGMGRAMVYELDIHNFRYLLAQRHPGTLHAMVGDLLQRAAEWERRLQTSLPWLGLVTRVLGQLHRVLEGRGAHRRCRESRYPPDAVAMAAMKVSASKESLSSRESSDNLALEFPKIKRRLHPFDNPPPPPYHPSLSNVVARLESFVPCSYVPRLVPREGRGIPESRWGCSADGMMVCDLEDECRVEADMAVSGCRVHDSGASSHSNVRFTLQLAAGYHDGFEERGVVSLAKGSLDGDDPGHQTSAKPLGLTRAAWGPLENGTCAEISSIPTPRVDTNDLPVNKETNLYSLKSEGQMEICTEQTESGRDQSQNSLKSQPRDSLLSLEPLFPSISPSTAHPQGVNLPQRTGHCSTAAPPQTPVPLQIQTTSGEGSPVVTVQQPPGLQSVHHPTDTHPHHEGTSQSSLDASVSSSNAFQVSMWVDPAAPKRSVGTPPHRSGDAPIGRHWRLPCIHQTVNTSPLPGASQCPPHGFLNTLRSAMDLIQDQRLDQSSEGTREQPVASTIPPPPPPHTSTTPPPPTPHTATTPPPPCTEDVSSTVVHGADICRLPSALRPSLVSCPPAELHGPPTTPNPDCSMMAESPVTEEPSDSAKNPDPKMMAESTGPSVTLCHPTTAGVFGSQGPDDPSLAGGPDSPLHCMDDTDNISAMWEVPINVFMREKTHIGSPENDIDLKHADLGPNGQSHSRKSALGARRTPGGGAQAYMRSRTQNYPLHRLWSSGGAVRPQQGVQPRRSIIDLAFEQQVQGKAPVVPKHSAVAASQYRFVWRGWLLKI